MNGSVGSFSIFETKIQLVDFRPSQTDQFFLDVPNPSQSCEPECCGKMGSIKETVMEPGCKCPRKRKERQDSTSEQDRKFSRSSSLEFPVADYKVKWRSASVSPMNEDFIRGDHVLHEVQECLVGNNMVFVHRFSE